MEDLKSEKILREVSKLMNEDVDFLDACLHYAQRNDIEVELIGEIVKRSKILKAKASESAENLNLIERTKKLPL